MSELKGKVEMLLSYFQASLYSHLIAVATDRDATYTDLGTLPFTFEDYLHQPDEPSQSLSHSLSIESRHREDSKAYSAANTSREEGSFPVKEDLITGSFLQSAETFIDSQEEAKVKSVKIDLSAAASRVEIRKKREIVEESLPATLEFSETEDYITMATKPRPPKALLRRLHQSDDPRPARFILDDPEPRFETISPDKPAPKTLYAEAITTTYSLGGDGFALHSGDVVMVLQFLEEYGLVEVRWEGLQGLFPVHALKVMTPVVDRPKLPSRILALAQKELLVALARSDASPTQNKSTKLLSRQRQREKFSG